MIKLFHVYFPTRTLLLAASEAFLIVLAFLTAALAWLAGETRFWLNYERGFLKIAIVSIACWLCMYYYDLYDSIVLRSLRETLTRLVQVLGTACVILALFYYAYPGVRMARGTFLTGIVLVGLLLAAWRNLFLTLNRSPRLVERTVILGEASLASFLAEEIEKRPELGMRLLGLVSHPDDPAHSLNGLRRLGGVEDLPALIDRERITHVIVAMRDRRRKLPVEDLLRLKTRGVLVQDGADLYEAVTGKVLLDSLQLSWLLFSPGFRLSWAMLLYKRVFSLIFSLLGLLLALPLMGLIAVAICFDSAGPIIFRQKRLGQEGKPFTLLKFRSMRNEADPDGKPVPARENDDRFTRVGRWLRRTRLDELPQLYNILRGDMHFIGPRPFVPEQEEECLRQIPFYSQRWSVKPGATGWAQIHRGYCASVKDNAEKLAYDLFYIKNPSIGLDLLILFETMKILLLRRGAR